VVCNSLRHERWQLRFGEFPLKKIFVYVMTHLGDPNEDGCWGCCDCMGQKRSWKYDAVIGVGGVGAEAYGFGGKLKWIGICPSKRPVASKRPKVTFEHFLDFGTEGRKVPPKLAAHIKKAPRGFMNLTSAELAEAKEILKSAKNGQRSPARAKRNAAYDQRWWQGFVLALAKSCSDLACAARPGVEMSQRNVTRHQLERAQREEKTCQKPGRLLLERMLMPGQNAVNGDVSSLAGTKSETTISLRPSPQ
jgi:hypothetical protein